MFDLETWNNPVDGFEIGVTSLAEDNWFNSNPRDGDPGGYNSSALR